MTNKTTTNNTSTTFTNEFIIDDQEDLLQPPLSPEPIYTSDGFGGIDQQDFRPDTQFIVDLHSDCKQPGTLTGESCPLSDLVNNSYDYLCSQYPHWRRLLSDDYMRNTTLGGNDDTNSAASTAPAHKKLKTSHNNTPPQQLVLLHIDDHAWASVVHYLTACKFINQPDIYNSLTLDSGDPLSQSSAQQVRQHAAQKFALSKEEEKDWYENGRKVEAWRRALLAKFAQNQDLQRALILTGWAKLVDKHERIQHLLMWVRTVLRGDHKEEEEKEVIPAEKKEEGGSSQNHKNVDEVFRVIEGLFGKDKQHVLSSILAGGAIVNAQQQQAQTQQEEQKKEKEEEAKVKEEEAKVKEEKEPKKAIEPKTVEMKDAVGYLEQIKTDEPPQAYSQFLEIMTDFRSEKINTPQVLERVTLLFKGKSWLIRNFLMFLPPGHILDLTPEGDKSNSIYLTSPAGKKIILNTDEGKVIFE